MASTFYPRLVQFWSLLEYALSLGRAFIFASLAVVCGHGGSSSRRAGQATTSLLHHFVFLCCEERLVVCRHAGVAGEHEPMQVLALPENPRTRVGERHHRPTQYINFIYTVLCELIEVVERIVIDRLVPGDKLGVEAFRVSKNSIAGQPFTLYRC